MRKHHPETNKHSSLTTFHLHHGDGVAGMERLEAGSVDVVVTSPPYNLGVKYSAYHDSRAWTEYLNWSAHWARAVWRVLRSESGALFLNVGGSPSQPLLPHWLACKFSEVFVLQNTFHWIKAITVATPQGREISAGHFKPINSARFVNDCHEYVFHFTKTGRVPIQRRAEGVGVAYADKSNIARWQHTKINGEGGGGGENGATGVIGERLDRRCRGNTWFVPYETIQSRERERPHPATFPVALAERCLRLHEVGERSTVLDPFLGIGSSALAARNCDAARFLGFEIDAEYLRIARERLEVFKSQAQLAGAI